MKRLPRRLSGNSLQAQAEALDNLNQLSQRLLKNLPLVHRKASVKVTNSIWCDATYDFTKEFADMCGLYYQAESHKYNAGTIEG